MDIFFENCDIIANNGNLINYDLFLCRIGKRVVRFKLRVSSTFPWTKYILLIAPFQLAICPSFVYTNVHLAVATFTGNCIDRSKPVSACAVPTINEIRMHFSSETLDDLMNDVLNELLNRKFDVVSTRGKSSEIVGVMLHLKNPRALVSAEQRLEGNHLVH